MPNAISLRGSYKNEVAKIDGRPKQGKKSSGAANVIDNKISSAKKKGAITTPAASPIKNKRKKKCLG